MTVLKRIVTLKLFKKLKIKNKMIKIINSHVLNEEILVFFSTHQDYLSFWIKQFSKSVNSAYNDHLLIYLMGLYNQFVFDFNTINET